MRDQVFAHAWRLETRDHELIARAETLLRKVWTPHRHEVASAVRMTSGFGFQAVNLESHSGAASVCAEPSAIAQGIGKGQGLVDTIDLAPRKWTVSCRHEFHGGG